MNKKHLIFLNHWNTTFYHNYRRTMETADQLKQSLYANYDDPIFKVLYDFFLPYYTEFRANYLLWLSQMKTYRGSSLALDEFIKELSGPQINIVDTFLKNVYIDDNKKYVTLMPKKRGPFQTGTYTDRILQTEQLADSMILRTELHLIAPNFKEFSIALGEGRDEQRINKQNVKSGSAVLEKSRVAIAGGLFYVYGGLIQIFYETPEDIADFYEINQMFAKKTGEVAANPDVTVVDLEPLETKEAGMNFVPTDIISASDVGNSDIEFWITDGTPPNANTKKGIIHSGEEFLIKPPEWATSDCRYLYFKCLDNEFNGIIHLVKVNPATT